MVVQDLAHTITLPGVHPAEMTPIRISEVGTENQRFTRSHGNKLAAPTGDQDDTSRSDLKFTSANAHGS